MGIATSARPTSSAALLTILLAATGCSASTSVDAAGVTDKSATAASTQANGPVLNETQVLARLRDAGIECAHATAGSPDYALVTCNGSVRNLNIVIFADESSLRRVVKSGCARWKDFDGAHYYAGEYTAMGTNWLLGFQGDPRPGNKTEPQPIADALGGTVILQTDLCPGA